MLGPAPVLHPPCGWELRTAGVFPWAGRSLCHLPALGSIFHVLTPFVHFLFLEKVFIPHFIAHLTIVSEV